MNFASTTEWVVRLSKGPLSPEEQAVFEQWLGEEMGRQQQVESAMRAWKLAGLLKGSAKARLYLDTRQIEIAREKRLRIRKRQILWFATPAIAAAALFMWSIPTSTVARLDEKSVARTSIGQIESYELPDQSHITIAADSAMQVSFGPTKRELVLSRGEAFFEVQSDAKRPFIIQAGDHHVRVTGTKFNVNYDTINDSVEVAVVEGSVAIPMRAAANGTRDEIVRAGQVVLVSANGALTYRSLTPEQASAWRTRQLYFEDARLSEILLEINRYSDKPIVALDTALNDLTLTGQFEAGDLSAFFYSLNDIYDVEVRDTPNKWELGMKPARR